MKKLNNLLTTFNLFESFINENFENFENRQEIINYVTNNSYFIFEEDEDDKTTIHFATRENGSVGDEEYSNIDYKEALKIKKELLSQFNDIEVKIETVDEFVLLNVSKKIEKDPEYRYTFKKDINGSGFSETFKSMEDLIEKYGDWIEVDWNEIIKKVDNINEYPDNSFTGRYYSSPLLIKRAGEEGNRWGYNFYIKKSKLKS